LERAISGSSQSCDWLSAGIRTRSTSLYRAMPANRSSDRWAFRSEASISWHIRDVAQNAVAGALCDGTVVKPIRHQMARCIQRQIRPHNLRDLLDVLPALWAAPAAGDFPVTATRTASRELVSRISVRSSKRCPLQGTDRKKAASSAAFFLSACAGGASGGV
jgi:hypothetical protein